MRTVRDFEYAEKRVLLRCDLNAPVEHGNIVDDFRLEQSVPTIQYLADMKAKVIILAHFGRPEGKAQKEFSLERIAQRLQQLVGREVVFVTDPIGEGAKERIDAMEPGDILLLENIRFYKGEEENDEEFAKQLASLGDIYVNDAFGTCHRAHASIVGISKFLPSAAGLLLEKEAATLGKIRENPEKPMVVAVGGTKVATKAAFLQALSKNASSILLGNLISQEAQEKGLKVAEGVESVYAEDGVDGDFDLGPATLKKFKERIQGARTIFWAGPLGMVEKEKYEKGSLEIANAMIESKAFAVAGGGDLAAFLGKHHLREKFDHVSTGGGAMLAFLSGEPLPGLEALEDSPEPKSL